MGKSRGCLDISPSPQPSPLKGEGVLIHALRDAGLPDSTSILHRQLQLVGLP